MRAYRHSFQSGFSKVYEATDAKSKADWNFRIWKPEKVLSIGSWWRRVGEIFLLPGVGKCQSPVSNSFKPDVGWTPSVRETADCWFVTENIADCETTK